MSESAAEPQPSPAPPIEQPLANDPSEQEPLELAWKRAVESWDDPAAHRAFVALASAIDQLNVAASRYRAAKETQSEPIVAGYRVPGDRASRVEIADRGLQLVLAQALARLDRMPRTRRARPGQWMLPVAALMMLLGLSFLGKIMTGRSVFTSLPVIALEMLVVAIIPWGRFSAGHHE
ncbi:MAG: hypothetical protein Q8Q09_23330 [Deltaproteobacteria bacterium]|nr:hypothetical protein [Deltaproteobacteria bacterium]